MPASIDPNRALLTVINTFEVEPLRADEVVRLLEDAIEKALRRLPGFVSASIHRAVDGRHVASYAQWTSEAAFEAMQEDPEARRYLELAKARALSATPVVYRVRSSFGAGRKVDLD